MRGEFRAGSRERGFTIVEFLVVMVVIGILAAIGIVSYSGFQTSAARTVLQSDLLSAKAQLEQDRWSQSTYPISAAAANAGEGLPSSEGTKYAYDRIGDSYCLTAWSAKAETSYFVEGRNGEVQEGTCTGHLGYVDGSQELPGDPNDPDAGGGDSGTPPPVAVSISTSGAHTCIADEGKAYCWGRNNEGQLGNGNKTSTNNVPVAVSTDGVLSGKTVTAISAGNGRTCAIADGKPYCWGDSPLGNGMTGTSGNSLIPVAVSTDGALSGKTVTAISAGSSHTCAVADGKAYCWRSFASSGGGTVTLKPDLFLVTADASTETHSFVEIDLGTEHAPAVLRKCSVYQRYARAGLEQAARGLFPAVVWIVPNLQRAKLLRERIDAEPDLDPGLFWIITPEAMTQQLAPYPPSITT